MKWQYGAMGLMVIVIVALIVIYRKTKNLSNNYENDLTVVAKNYNALASGVPSELKDNQLITLTLGDNNFLAAASDPKTPL